MWKKDETGDFMEVISTMMLLMRKLSICGSLMIIAVIMLRAFTIRTLPKRTFPVLWTIAMLRLLIPVFPESDVSIYRLFLKIRAQMVTGNASHFSNYVQKITEGADRLVDGDILWSSGETAATAVLPADLWLMGLWFVGTVMTGAAFLTMYLRYRRRFCTALPLRQELSWNSTTLRKVDVKVSDQILTPLSYGIFHPVILFPAGMDWEDEEAVTYILVHEAIHIRRFDGLVKGMSALAVSLYWWNPLTWVMFLLLARDMELACDEAVVERMGRENRSVYAMTLIRMEERRGSCGALYSHFSENAIEERITAIMKMKKTSVLALVCALCLVVGMTVVFGTSEPGNNGDMIVLLPEEMHWPAEDCDQITLTFGERIHPVTGEKKMVDHITISDSTGEALGKNVLASCSGTVTETGYEPDMGNYLVIDHGNGLMTKYTHCKEILMAAGDSVEQGEVIGTLGKTGKVTGPCLGFYVYQDGEVVDPDLFL